MNINENLIPFSQKEENNNQKELEINNNIENNNYYPLPQLTKINKLNLQNEEKEIDEIDDTDNLKFKDDNQNNLNPCIKQRIDSCDSSSHFKYSIDIPNIPRDRLHDFLNEDLLNALDSIPNITNLNNDMPNNGKVSVSKEKNESQGFLRSFLNSQQNNINNSLDINKYNKKNDINNFSEINNNNSNNNFQNIFIMKEVEESGEFIVRNIIN